jgi:hypothetical protein
MGERIVDIIKIKFGFKFGICRACKKIKTSVKAKYSVTLFNYRFDRSEDKNIIKSFFTGKITKILYRVVYFCGFLIYL